jgi:hypothetical protein
MKTVSYSKQMPSPQNRSLKLFGDGTTAKAAVELCLIFDSSSTGIKHRAPEITPVRIRRELKRGLKESIDCALNLHPWFALTIEPMACKIRGYS